MADAPTRSGAVGAITRKVGPLPLWGWAAILVVGYLAYRHFGGGTTSSTAPASTDATANPVPGFDAAGIGGSGGIGDTGVPSTVNNYYYGDLGTAQANGGGTAAGSGSPAAPASTNLASGGTPSKLPSYTLNLAALGVPSPVATGTGFHTSAPGRFAV